MNHLRVVVEVGSKDESEEVICLDRMTVISVGHFRKDVFLFWLKGDTCGHFWPKFLDSQNFFFDFRWRNFPSGIKYPAGIKLNYLCVPPRDWSKFITWLIKLIIQLVSLDIVSFVPTSDSFRIDSATSLADHISPVMWSKKFSKKSRDQGHLNLQNRPFFEHLTEVPLIRPRKISVVFSQSEAANYNLLSFSSSRTEEFLRSTWWG